MSNTPPISLKQSEKIMREVYKRYLKKRKMLTAEKCRWYEQTLQDLQKSLWKKNRSQSSELATALMQESHLSIPSGLLHRGVTFIASLVFALLIALLIRQMWFELYAIPSGSMRPTLKEQDKLLVSKTDFGINTPWSTGHLVFQADLVKRGGIVVFSGEGIDLPNPDTFYFYVLPGKKQYVKRMIGKPGDRIYFHGGLLYGIDKEGNAIEEFAKFPWFTDLEHIPFMKFDGKRIPSDVPLVDYLYQMNQAVAKIQVTAFQTTRGEMLSPYHTFKQYFDLWGIKNYAMARIVPTSKALKSRLNTEMEFALELTHHPVLNGGEVQRSVSGFHPNLALSTSYLPLSESALHKIFSALYTARFKVKDGYAFRADLSYEQYKGYGILPKFPVSDGTYEIENGIAYKVFDYPIVGGVRRVLPPDHFFSTFSPATTARLFNIGMQLIDSPLAIPDRYAYFRGGDLYLMGAPIFNQKDADLTLFTNSELEKEKLSTSVNPYFPFIQTAPPILEDGSLDKEFLMKNGITVPENSYLVLGDNHANSADSRIFGFVPVENLRGGPSFLFWPPSSRWGWLPQTRYEFFSLSSITIWIIAALTAMIFYLVHKKRKTTPLRF